jgi:RNA polymerase sigma factor (sigma-70 family)
MQPREENLFRMASAIPLSLLEPNPISLSDVVVSHQLLSRRMHKASARAEIKALHDLAEVLPQGPSAILKRLAWLAVELCNAGSGGISMLEAGSDGNPLFRWRALAGELEPHEGGTTPRDWSPCGECLRAGKPVLYSYPARFFTYFQAVDTILVEGLVIPMYAEGLPIGTIWIISHDARRLFDAEDVRIMTGLGNFAAAALRITATPGIAREVVWDELVNRIADGDHSALEALIDETRPFIFTRALKILSSPADAEEAVVDVYAQVWNTAGRYDPHRVGVLPWLLNIVRSRSIDRLRSRARHDRQSEAGLCLECSNTIDLENNAARYEMSTLVGRALEALSFEQRQAIELAYFEGYSMTEIASRLDRPLGTVKTRVRGGLIALRRLMATTESHIPAGISGRSRQLPSLST